MCVVGVCVCVWVMDAERVEAVFFVPLASLYINLCLCRCPCLCLCLYPCPCLRPFCEARNDNVHRHATSSLCRV